MLTFHKIIAGCAAGRREAWQSFLAEYTPGFTGLLGVNLGLAEVAPAEAVWQASLTDLVAEQFERLRSLDKQSEKEFLLGLRHLVLTRAASTIRSNSPPASSSLPQHPAIEGVEKWSAGLPLVHQQFVFLKLAGYRESAIENVLRVTPAVTQEGLKRIPDGARMERAEWFGLLQHAWSIASENCPQPRRLIRIQEGQVSWYDRDAVEQHLVSCLHCLELWTALVEVRYWRSEVRPLAPAKIDELLAALPIKAASAEHKSTLSRILRSKRV